MWMYGSISAEDLKSFNSRHVSIHSLAEGDEADGVYYENGQNGLYQAAALWNLMGSEKGKRLEQLLKNVVTNNNYTEDQGYLMDAGQVEHAAALLDGLEEAMQEYVDDGWNIRPEKLDYVRQHASYLIKRSQDADGTVYERITEPLWEATWAARFLKVAARLHREVWLG